MASPLARTADAPNGAPAVVISRSADAAPQTADPAAPPPVPAPSSTIPPAPLSEQVAVMLLADVAAPWRAWGWWRIARGAQSFRGTPGLAFAKVLGSGYEGGFGLRPSRSRQGVFAVFADEAQADAFIADAPSMRAYRERSSELCVLKLRAWSCRGRWSGHTLAPGALPPDAANGSAMPVVALTRASIHWRRAAAFWRKAPPAQAALADAPGCLLAAGLGEAPLLRQATFSLWESVEAMDAYARSGAHLEAIRAAAREGYFSESMFVRFVPVSMHGRWKGATYG